MKRIYWRPRAVSRTALVLIAVISLSGFLLVENLPVNRQRPHYEEKLAAAERAAEAFEMIYNARLSLGPDVDVVTDPAQSGLIGIAMSPVTSVSGEITAKQTSANPNFAAVLVDMLKRAGVNEGDVVAVGLSGSFPALNVCALAALETLKAKPVVISSVSASQWGANVPELTWIDMERILAEEDVISTRSVACTIGGYEDRGLGLSDEGLELVQKAIDRNGVPLLDALTFEESIARRLELYREKAGRKPIKAYVNVGGGAVSIGRTAGKKLFSPGLNQRPPGRIAQIDGVAPRLINEGIPVVHIIQIVDLAERYGLPVAPTVMPEVGEGAIYSGLDYNYWLVTIVLVVILVSLYGFIRSDIGFRLLKLGTPKKQEGHPEPMV